VQEADIVDADDLCAGQLLLLPQDPASVGGMASMPASPSVTMT
jgi:hypothetical protein